MKLGDLRWKSYGATKYEILRCNVTVSFFSELRGYGVVGSEIAEVIEPWGCDVYFVNTTIRSHYLINSQNFCS